MAHSYNPRTQMVEEGEPLLDNTVCLRADWNHMTDNRCLIPQHRLTSPIVSKVWWFDLASEAHYFVIISLTGLVAPSLSPLASSQFTNMEEK